MSRIIKQRVVLTVQIDLAIDEELAKEKMTKQGMEFSFDHAREDVFKERLANDALNALRELFPKEEYSYPSPVTGKVSVNQTYGDCWAVEKEDS